MTDRAQIETEADGPRIWTIGHSNRALEVFLELLQGAGVERVADVRRFPGSRKHPHFGQQALREALRERSIDYHHLPALGGRRNARQADSPNTGWQVEAFRAYADYMATAEFAAALAELEQLARERSTTTMCSEAVPWRCHRRLISDALVIRGWQVIDIMAVNKQTPHRLTAFAVVQNGTLTYPGRTLFT